MNLTKIVSTLTASSVAVLCSFVTVSAQVIPDGTTPTTVDVNGTIDGGNAAGTNLFHSFSEFSIPDGGRAFFNNNLDIINIFSRVTGGKISDINGLLGANGTANLFFINPAGIIFGENARLDIGGSFYGSSAGSILFPEGKFSALEPNSGITITINAPLGLGDLRGDSGDIVNRSQFELTEKIVNEGTEFESTAIDNISGLKVDDGQNITLVGGNILLERSGITSRGGRVELGGLSAPGDISINPDGSLTFPDNVPRSDVILNNGSLVTVSSGGGGDININARQLNLSEQSQLIGGIASGTNNPQAQGGDIRINATESITLTGVASVRGNGAEQSIAPAIRNFVSSDAVGNSGDINITTQTLNVFDVAGIQGGVEGIGISGDIIINAKDITFKAQNPNPETPDRARGFIFNQLNGNGNTGDIIITTESLLLDDLGRIDTGVQEESQGNGGDILINASKVIVLDGEGFITSELHENSVGTAGNVIINAGILQLQGDSFITTATRGEGTSGNININTTQVSLTGGRRNNTFIFASTTNNGNSGDIKINATESLSLTEGSFINNNVETDATGNGGDIIVTSPNVVLDNGSRFISNTKGFGDAGNIVVNANNLTLQGSSFFVNSNEGSGNGGNIRINATNQVLFDGSYLNSGIPPAKQLERTVFGKAGDIQITTGDLIIRNGSLLTSNTKEEVQAGDFQIIANNLELTSGGKIVAATSGIGNSGSININVTDNIDIDGSNPIELIISDPRANPFIEEALAGLKTATGLFANTVVSAQGDGGNIQVNTGGDFKLSNQAQISVSSLGQGSGGSITINADSLSLDNQASIKATSTSGTGSNISLQIPGLISLGNNSLISTSATGEANGGNININTDIDTSDSLIFAAPNQNNDIIANAQEGRGGNIIINAQAVFGIEERRSTPENITNDIDATANDFRLNGNVSINLPDTNAIQETTEFTTEELSTNVVRKTTCSAEGDVETGVNLVQKGKGGVPPEPTEPMMADRILSVENNPKPVNSNQSTVNSNQLTVEGEYEDNYERMVELYKDDPTSPYYIPPYIKPVEFSDGAVYPARGIARTPDGRIILTAYPTNNNGERLPYKGMGCD